MANLMPFNIRIPAITKQTVKNLPEVSTTDIFEGSSKVFHPNGLFSIESFGRLGSEQRTGQIGHINLRVRIFHPKIYDLLKRIKGLYAGILEGKRYALWDEANKDFIPSTEMEGKTGAAFFMRHWKELQFQRNKSNQRSQRIDVIEKYRDVALSEHVLVLPAGLRDIQEKDDGRVEEDEINGMYRKLITLSRSVTDTSLGQNSPILDGTRHVMQQTFNEIYDYLFQMLRGKSGFMESKFSSRRIFYGTRNVMTAMDIAPSVLGAVNSPSLNDTVVGLFQTMRGTLPVTISRLLDYTSNRFNRQSGQAMVYDEKTMRRISVDLTVEEIDKFTTTEGIDKFINLFTIRELRHRPVRVGKNYLGLIYVDDQQNFMHVDDIDQLPDGLDPKWVRPITYAELFYLCNYRGWKDMGCFITRFPIAGEGSIYPSHPYVKTTIKAEVRYQLGPDGKRVGGEYVAPEFPLQSDDRFHESVTPHLSRLEGMGGDYDGDMVSVDYTMSEDSKEEIKAFLKKKRAYVSIDGRLRTTLKVNAFNLFLENFTFEREA